MPLHQLASRFLCLARRYQIDPESSAYQLLLKIDTSPHHYLPTEAMTPEELAEADILARKKWIELVPADHAVSQRDYRAPRIHAPLSSRPLPERYVMLAGGSYALGTFDLDTLREEELERARRSRF